MAKHQQQDYALLKAKKKGVAKKAPNKKESIKKYRGQGR